ncbi:MAG: hypothetical protein KAJ28_01185 [Flavobacteriaceae bacterium]|nr:hypothetical protein [Flavobacteriaceae bacterium]
MTEENIEKGKTIAIISYLTIFGTIIAFYMNNETKNKFASFHIRQSLGLWLTFFILGYLIGNFNSWPITFAFWIFFGVLFIYGFITAVTGKAYSLPLVGNFYQKIFAGIGK